jgi:hypothetical protein
VNTAIRTTLRSIATVLSFAILFQQFVHAATPSRHLTALQQAAEQQQTTAPAAPAQQLPAPIERQDPATQAQTTGPSVTPPLAPEAMARERLLSAHTLFLARSTQDANFPASPDAAYNLVLSKLQNWGHFQLVDNIAQADLVLQLRDAVKTSVVDDANDPATTVYYIPSFQITIADPTTLSPIWTVSTSVPTALKAKNESTLLSAAAENVVSQLKLLVGDTLTTQDVTAQKQVNHYYRSHLALMIGLGAAAAGLSLGLFFLFKHNAENNQAAFCNAHGISPCPGA